MFDFLKNIVSLLASFFGMKQRSQEKADDKKIDTEEIKDADLQAAVEANTTRADFNPDAELLLPPDKRDGHH